MKYILFSLVFLLILSCGDNKFNKSNDCLNKTDSIKSDSGNLIVNYYSNCQKKDISCYDDMNMLKSIWQFDSSGNKTYVSFFRGGKLLYAEMYSNNGKKKDYFFSATHKLSKDSVKENEIIRIDENFCLDSLNEKKVIIKVKDANYKVKEVNKYTHVNESLELRIKEKGDYILNVESTYIFLFLGVKYETTSQEIFKLSVF